MINLLPPETKSAIKYARMNVTLIGYCILVLIISLAVLAIVLFGWILLAKTNSDLKKSITEDRAKVTQLASKHTEAKKIAETVNTIGSLINNEVKFSGLLTEIGSILPRGAALTSLSLSENRTDPLTLDAIVVDENTAAVMKENFGASDLFSNANILSVQATTPVSSGGITYRYNVSVQVYFKPPGAVKP